MTTPTDTNRSSHHDDFFNDSLTARELVARLIDEEKHALPSPDGPRFLLVTIL